MKFKNYLFFCSIILFFSFFTNNTAYAATSVPVINLTSSTTGGALSANYYSYEVTSTVSTTESSPSNYQTIVNTGSTSSNTLTWSAISGATYYTIYRSLNGGTFTQYAQTTSTSFTDNGWNSSANTLPKTLDNAASVIYKPSNGTSYIYILGGNDGSNNQSSVYYAAVNPATGNIGAWNTSANPLPQGLGTHAAVIYQSGSTPYIYVLGGRNASNANQNTVYYASINTTTGDINSWNTSSHTLPANLFAPSAVIYQTGSTPYIYVIAGQNGGFTNQDKTYYASVNTSTGDVGAWSTSSNNLPQGLNSAAAVINESGSTPYIYVLGGGNGTANQNTVYYTAINTSSGNIGAWSNSANTMPVGLGTQGAGLYMNGSTPYIYVMAGRNDSGNNQNISYYTTINTSTNNINTWTTATNLLPQQLFAPTSVIYTTGSMPYVYILGGQNGSFSNVTSVYYTQPFQLGSNTTQSGQTNVQIDYSNTQFTINQNAFSIDETEYLPPNQLTNDTTEQTRIKALHPQTMRIDLHYKTAGDHNSGIVCGASGCDQSISGDSWINTIKAIGASPEILVPLNASDAASIVQHFNKDTNNYVGRWVIGNEPDNGVISAAAYSSSFNTEVDAMKAIDATIKVGGAAVSVFDAQNTAYTQTFLNNSGSKTDFVIFHDYGEGNAQPTDTLLANTLAFEQDVTLLRNMLTTTLGAARGNAMDIEVGEWSLTYNAGDSNEFQNFTTVWTASVLGHIIKGGGLSGYYGSKTNLLFGGVNNTYGTVLDDYKPAYHGLGMFMGENLFSSFGTDLVSANTTLNRVEVYASNNPKNIVMINKDATSSASVNVSLSGIQAATIQIWRKDQTMNQFSQPVNVGSLSVTNGTFTYSLPAYSVTTFVLTTPNATPPTFSNASGPSAPSQGAPAWAYGIDAGPHSGGVLQFISGAGDASNALAFIGSNAVHDDIHLIISKINPFTILHIPLPWKQGFATVGDIFEYQALSSFNGFPITLFDNPVTIILPYDQTKLKELNPHALRIAFFNTATKKWQLLSKNVIVNTKKHTVSTTVKSFGYFVVVYPKSGNATAAPTVLSMQTVQGIEAELSNTKSKSTTHSIPTNNMKIIQKQKNTSSQDTHCFLSFCF